MNSLVANIFNKTITHYSKTGSDGWGDKDFSEGVDIPNTYIEGDTVEVKVSNLEVKVKTLLRAYLLADRGIKVDDEIAPPNSPTERYRVILLDKVDFSGIGFTTVDQYLKVEAIRV